MFQRSQQYSKQPKFEPNTDQRKKELID